MNSFPKVSIISVFYNREKTAENSVKSLLDQTYQNLDIIIVDDYSMDSTNSIIKKVINNDPRVTFIENKVNKGFVNSLIDVINSLDSTYVAIHGAGDVSLPKRVETQVEFLENNLDVGVVSVGVINRDIDNISKVPKKIQLKDQLKRNNLNHGATMFRLDDYKKVGGYRPYFVQRQDKDLWYRMSLITKLYFIPDKLYKWQPQEFSVSSNTGKNITQSLLSEFATFLILERIKFGYDSLDKYGEKSGLMFIPSSANHIFFRDFWYCFFRFRFVQAANNLNSLKKINSNFFLILYINSLIIVNKLFLYFKRS